MSNVVNAASVLDALRRKPLSPGVLLQALSPAMSREAQEAVYREVYMETCKEAPNPAEVAAWSEQALYWQLEHLCVEWRKLSREQQEWNVATAKDSDDQYWCHPWCDGKCTCEWNQTCPVCADDVFQSHGEHLKEDEPWSQGSFEAPF